MTIMARIDNGEVANEYLSAMRSPARPAVSGGYKTYFRAKKRPLYR